jgi:hypothetical protein
MIKTGLFGCFALVWLLPLQSATAHVGPPISLHITELPSHQLQVQWRVPKALPAMAAPVPVVPDHCTALDQPTRQDQTDVWLHRQQFRCPYAIDGHEVGMRYPPYDPAITFIRVELATQAQYVHVLAPDERVWRIPEGRSDWLREAQIFVLKGALHILGHWIHAAFVLALCLLHRLSRQVRCITAFTAGQMLAGGLVVMRSISSSPHYAEAALALAVVFLALEGVRRRSGDWQLILLTAAAGLMHGGGVAASILPGQDLGCRKF